MRKLTVAIGVSLLCCSFALADADQSVKVKSKQQAPTLQGSAKADVTQELSADKVNPSQPQAVKSRGLSAAANDPQGVQELRIVTAPEGTKGTSRSRTGDNTCDDPVLIPAPPVGDPLIYTDELRWRYPGDNLWDWDFEHDITCGDLRSQINLTWYKFTATHSTVRISTCAEHPNRPPIPDTKIALLEGDICGLQTELACNDDFGCLTSDYPPDWDGLGSQLEYSGLTVGDEYFVVVCHTAVCAGDDCSYTFGSYNISIENDDFEVCTIQCTGRNEREYDPSSWPFNDGCEMPAEFPVAFSEIECGETICGTSYKNFGLGASGDVDYYELYLMSPGSINLSFEAEFAAEFAIVQPGSPDPCMGYSDLVSTVVDECTPGTLSQAGLSAGIYWLRVQCDPDNPGAVQSGKKYRLTVTSSCATATGACCVGTDCTPQTRADCEGNGGTFWGQGVACADVACYECPSPHTPEFEQDCFDGWTDSFNAGCGFDEFGTAFNSEINCGDVICGTAGTHVTNNENRRDNDYYYLFQLPVDPGMSVQLNAEVVAEFPVELLLITFADYTNPCPSFIVASEAHGLPGEIVSTSYCYTRPDPAPVNPLAGEAWVIVRPWIRGGTREIPCGVEYTLELSCGPCDPGACCLPTGCVEGYDTDTCAAEGGTFGGSGSTCADICCPPHDGVPLENEPDCGQPNDTVNGGCNDIPNFVVDDTSLYTAGSSVWGTSLWDGNTRDTDWYAYEHLGGDLNFCVIADFIAQPLVIYQGNPNPADPNYPCDDYSIVAGEAAPAACEEFCLTVVNAQPGMYWLWMGPDFDLNEPFACGKAYLASVYTEQTGACCFPDESCQQLDEATCTGQGGAFQGPGSDCAPNPCCTAVECPVGAADENEPDCGTPEDTVNGGCNSLPNYVADETSLYNAGSTVCGTSLYNGSTRDTDWYLYNHVGGDINFCVTADFLVQPLIIYQGNPDPQDPNYPCDDYTILAGETAPSDCGEFCLTVTDATPGLYWLWVGPSFDSGTFDCEGEYVATVSTAVTGACCVDTTCQQITQAECDALEGIYQGDATTCFPNPCCEMICDPNDALEVEPDCGLPEDNTNGGCNSDPFVFDTTSLANPGDSVCGTAAFDGSLRDTDWYEYQHAGGDMSFCVEADFYPLLLIIREDGNPQDPNYPCDNYEIVDGGTLLVTCEEVCITVPGAQAGRYWLFVGPDFDENQPFACGGEYRARIQAGELAACCLPDGTCFLALPDVCADEGGTYNAGLTCDPNPCCEVVCDDAAVDEGEPDCGFPTDTTNAGCWGNGPENFGTQLATPGSIVCGTLRADPNDPNFDDLDFYEYTHTSGDLQFVVASEVWTRFLVLIPPCSDNMSGWQEFTLADCLGYLIWIDEAALTPGGTYYLAVQPAVADVGCGSTYEASVHAGETGACCFDLDCVDVFVESLCVQQGGTWIGAGVGCDPNPCQPAGCKGDSNCDGNVNWRDIDFFVAAQNDNVSAWYALHLNVYGTPPTCPFENNDIGGPGGISTPDGTVSWRDIDGFVALQNTTCP